MITKYVLRNKYFTQLLLIIFCTCCALTTSVHAQAVHIPDSNLRIAIVQELNLPHNSPVTIGHMGMLTTLAASDRGISSLEGLQHATHLKNLSIGGNAITDLSPVATLVKLEALSMPVNPLSDLSPIADLINLTYLDFGSCRVSDLTPLMGLRALTHLECNSNAIIDVAPLAALTRLELLEIQRNQIFDHSPLDALPLRHFVYDQSCEMAPLPLTPRLQNRTYPSIFTRWTAAPILNIAGLSDADNLAYHDLRWNTSPFGLRFMKTPQGFQMAGDVDTGVAERESMHSLNPNMVHLVDVGIRAAPLTWFPEDSPYWIRDDNGKVFIEIYEGQPVSHGLLDFTKPIVQDRIVEQAIAVAKCGLFDGIFFDYWAEHIRVLGGDTYTGSRFFRTLEEEQHARDIIIRRIRDRTRPNFLIIGNTSVHTIPRTAPYINGSFMETGIPHDMKGKTLFERVAAATHSLRWLERHARQPRVNCLEGYTIPSEPPDSPENLRWMRVVTTLSLTHSDGYVLFNHSTAAGHYWYDFWDADLGRPVGEKGQLYQEAEGLFIREFTNGWAVYNHSGETQEITLPEPVTGVASGIEDTMHTLPNLDGEMYLRVMSANPVDVNEDGVVNILDLILVAQAIGTEKSEPDVNGDGVINVFDLVMVAGAIGGGGAAPSAYSPELSIISVADVARWLALAQGLGVGDANFQRGIRFLEGLLAALTPKETTLLPNYPNPFNPETWIPYHLARETEVSIMIYDTKGTLVRRLALGNQSAGYYAERGKAAYWDGRNEDGEAVASGIYIYQFRAGDYAASRRMVIVK